MGAAGAVLVLFSIDEDAAEAVPPPPPGHPLPPPVPLKLDARISRNHGHVYSISLDDVGAALDKTYDLTGTSGHRHEVTVTKADFLALQRSEIVRLASTPYGGHLHRLYARVRPGVLPPDEVTVCEIFIGGKDDHELVIRGATRSRSRRGAAPKTTTPTSCS
jgi:hypothetical protein